MKQGNDVARFGIYSSEVWSFVKIAVDAGEREIVELVRSAMLAGDDVFHMQCGEQRICLSELTVFAAILGSPSYRCASRFIHRLLRADLPESLGLSFENGNELVCPDVAGILGPFFFGKLSLGRFFSQLFNARLQRGLGLIVDHQLRSVRKHHLQERDNAAVKSRCFGGNCHTAIVPRFDSNGR